MSESSDGKKCVHSEEHDKDGKNSTLQCFKQAKVARIANARPEGVRLRTEEGVPATKSSFDHKDEKMSRSCSDPKSPDNVVNIYDAKGLFGDHSTGQMNGQAIKKANAQTTEEGAQFFDPVFQGKPCGTNTLRTRFEAIQTKPSATGEEFLSDYKNPLHKLNGKSVNDETKHESKKETKPMPPPKRKNSTITKPLPEIPKKPLPQTPNPHSPVTPKKQPPLVPKKPNFGNGNKPEIGKKPELPKQKQLSKESSVESKSELLAATFTIGTVAVPVISPMTETEVAFTENASDGFSESVYSNVSGLDGEHEDMSALSNGQIMNEQEHKEHSKTDRNKERADWDNDNEPVGNLSDFDEDESGDEEEQGGRISLETSDLVFPDSRSKKLYNIALEILTTERAYVRRLHLLDQVFHAKLDTNCREKGIIPADALATIFGNIKAIHQLHDNFLLPKLEDRMNQWGRNNRIGDILKTLAPFLKLYTDYIGNFDKATEAVGVWMKKSSKFAAIIDEIQKTRECENLTLHHHMLEPIQRVPRYKMLLTDYLSKLPEDSPDVKDTKDALAIISESATHANESMKRTDKFKKLLDIQDKLGESFHVVTASREFVKEGDLFKVSARTGGNHQPRTLILFSDVLLCCSKVPATNKYKVKVSMDVYGMQVCAVDDEVEDENTFRISSKQKVIDFAAGSVEEQQEWLNCLQKTISEHEMKKNSYKRANKLQETLTDSELGKKAPAWVRDESVSMCMSCDSIFTAIRRRHHCRACGLVLCGKCSQFRAPLDYDGGKQNRVCTKCYRVLVKGDKLGEKSEKKSKNILKMDDRSNVQISGYLNYKHSGDKSWVKRWFVLLDNFVLYCHKAKKDTKAEFSLPLPGYFVDKPTLGDDIDKKFVIKVHHKNMRIIFFEAEDENSLKRWTNFLSFAVRAEHFREDKEEDNLKRANEIEVTVI